MECIYPVKVDGPLPEQNEPVLYNIYVVFVFSTPGLVAFFMSSGWVLRGGVPVGKSFNVCIK